MAISNYISYAISLIETFLLRQGCFFGQVQSGKSIGVEPGGEQIVTFTTIKIYQKYLTRPNVS